MLVGRLEGRVWSLTLCKSVCALIRRTVLFSRYQVEDIYGGDYTAIGLKGTIVASTFGKLQHNCPKALKPAEMCPKKWIKQTHRRRERKSKNWPSHPADATPRVDSSERNPSSILGELVQSHGDPSTRSDSSTSSLFSVSPIRQRVSLFASEANTATPQATSAAESPSVDETYHVVDAPNSLFTAGMIRNSESYQSISSNVDRSSSLSTVLGSTCCADPFCCCCGLQKWASCEDTEASAAAALGLLEDQGFEEHRASGVNNLLTHCIRDLETELSSDQCRTHVALDPLKGVVDDEMSEKRRRTFSIDQFTRQVRSFCLLFSAI